MQSQSIFIPVLKINDRLVSFLTSKLLLGFEFKHTQLWPHISYENNVKFFQILKLRIWEQLHFLAGDVTFPVMPRRRKSCNLQYFPLKTSSHCQPELPKAQSRGSSCPSFPWAELSAEELLLNEPQEPCWVYLSWVYIRSDFCWSLHFSSFHLSLAIVPVGEGCVCRAPEPVLCLQIHLCTHLCPVHTSDISSVSWLEAGTIPVPPWKYILLMCAVRWDQK